MENKEVQNNEAENMTLEDAFLKLDETITKLETEDISLEESFQIYKEGMDLLKDCNQKIDSVEKKVMLINEAGELSEF